MISTCSWPQIGSPTTANLEDKMLDYRGRTQHLADVRLDVHVLQVLVGVSMKQAQS